MGSVWFVGAGPGHPDLITVRGRDLLAQAGAVLYAGSLVSEAHMAFCPPACLVADSSGMTLEAMNAWLLEQSGRHETVVRLQTGDPSLYGALAEMAAPLLEAGVEVRSVPGVSSAMASAAAALETLTLPEITQTVILTRTEGRTPMPYGERLRDLARHRATLCIYLSATLMSKVADELRGAGWPNSSPILVVHKASWPGEERILRSTVGTFAALCREEGIRSQTMIIASPALDATRCENTPKSLLYDASFSHEYRQAATAPHAESSDG
ncbi:MAG: precorrin-4 C(11)-methyltransferase [Magnetococcales bacterium]|nr:precorrin-4 C(11)-methyltransferase [Magnetococcales bacterium]